MMWPATWWAQWGRQLQSMQSQFDRGFDCLVAGTSGPSTPADVVATDGRVHLLHYHPAGPAPAVPVLIVPSPLIRYTVLDLLPGDSLVEFLVGRGLDVYLLDWGAPSREDRFITFDEQIATTLRRAVAATRRATGGGPISLLGYSLGGTLAVIYSALYPEDVRTLVTFAAPVDFREDGLMAQWTRPDRFNIDLVVDTLGAMPQELMRASFRMFKPTALIAGRLAEAARLNDITAVQDYLAMQTWITDDLPYWGETYRKLIKDCYQANYLVQGKLVVDGRRVDLGRITCPVLVLTADHDLICPPASAEALLGHVAGSDHAVVRQPGGHVGLVVGRRAASELWPRLVAWLLPRSAELPAE